MRTFVPGVLVLESACQFFGAACLDRVRLRFGQRAAETRCTCRDLRTRTRACLAQKAFARARPVPGIRKLLQRPSNPVAILRRDTDVAVGPGLVRPPLAFAPSSTGPKLPPTPALEIGRAHV